MQQDKLTLTILGTFQATCQDQLVLEFPTDKIRALLVYLSLSPEGLHRRDELASLLWSDWQGAEAKRNLRLSLYRLKQTLQKASPALGDELLEVTRQHIRLQVEWIDVDVWRWQSLLKEALAHEDASSRPLVPLTEALELFQGELMAGFVMDNEPLFADWLQQQRERFHEQLTTALERAAQLHRARCEYEQADHYLLRWLALEPWNEEAHRERMRTLAMSGQRSAALAQYNLCVSNLLEEFQADPTDETVTLYEQIHYEEIEIDKGSEQEPPREALSSPPRLSNILPRPSMCIGRTSELDELEAMLVAGETRLLTLLGGGGSGKTTVCRELLHRSRLLKEHYTDGVFIIPLASVHQPSELPSVLAQSLGLATQMKGESTQRCCDFLRNKRALLFWDHFEHGLDAIPLLQTLLEQTPHVTHLVASRVPLELSSERRYPLQGLAPQDAVTLFTYWAHKVEPHFDHAHEADAIAAICQQVSGVPLAVELAANWVQMFDCKEIHHELQRDGSLLHTEWSDFPEHHRSMQSIFAQTWKWLSPEQQRAFACIAVFRGGFGLKEARQIAKTSLGTLMSLWERALLQQPQKGRFLLQELLLHFARQKLEELPNAQDYRDAHTAHFLSMLQEYQDGFVGRFPHRTKKILEQELDNIRAAWQRAILERKTAALIAAAKGLSLLFQALGLFAESEKLFSSALQACDAAGIAPSVSAPLLLGQAFAQAHIGRHEQVLLSLGSFDQEHDLPGPQRAELYRILGHAYVISGAYDQAFEVLTKASELYKTNPDIYGQSDTTTQLGRVHWRRSEYQSANRILQDGLSYDRATGYKYGIAQKLNLLGFTCEGKAAHQQSLDYLEQALAIVEELDYQVDEARYLNNIGVIYRRLSQLDQALTCYKRSQAIFQTLGLNMNVSACHVNIGVIHWHLGQYDEALASFREALHLQRELGEESKRGVTLSNMGKLYKEKGEFREAITCLEEAMALEQALGHQKEVGRIHGLLAEVHNASGSFEEALEHIEKGLTLIRKLEYVPHLSWLLATSAEALYQLGRTKDAKEHIEEAIHIAQELQRTDIIEQGEALLEKLAAA